MKTKTNFLKTAILIATIIISYACKGPEGDPGPQGNAGQNGKDGSNGKDGATGAKGDKGDTGGGTTTASNVFYSDWLSVQFTGFSEYTATINAPKITQEIIDKGTVVTYAKSNVSGNVLPLPFAALDGTTRTTVTYNLNVINLRATFDASAQKYRYIIFPPGSSIGPGRKKALESLSYEEVKALYNIKN